MLEDGWWWYIGWYCGLVDVMDGWVDISVMLVDGWCCCIGWCWWIVDVGGWVDDGGLVYVDVSVADGGWLMLM